MGSTLYDLRYPLLLQLQLLSPPLFLFLLLLLLFASETLATTGLPTSLPFSVHYSHLTGWHSTRLADFRANDSATATVRNRLASTLAKILLAYINWRSFSAANLSRVEARRKGFEKRAEKRAEKEGLREVRVAN